jgi:hypothetical protein
MGNIETKAIAFKLVANMLSWQAIASLKLPGLAITDQTAACLFSQG